MPNYTTKFSKNPSVKSPALGTIKFPISAKNSAAKNELDRLVDYSPADANWDTRRGDSDDVGLIYEMAKFERYAQRIADCSGRLHFAEVVNSKTGEVRFRLREARFCRVRYCPVCQARRALMWRARFYQKLPGLVEEYPKSRWLFLTLTVRNCPITELGDTLTAMNIAWRRLIDRKEFRPVQGWAKTTEVTRGANGSAHPHFHVLLMAPPSMLAKNYVAHARWVELWRDCLRADYDPNVDIRTVKPTKQIEKTHAETPTAAMRGAIAETLKYAVKPSDMLSDPAWFIELTKQTHKRRFVATGGALSDVLRVEQESDEELALADDVGDGEEVENGALLAFDWGRTERQYRRAPKADKPPPRD